jgi:CubicO group peptidase (beta-lactamase class C family)
MAKLRRVKLNLFVLSVLLTACASAPPDERAEAARSALTRAGFVGSALVACGDEVVFQGDFHVADPGGRTPSYWVASMSKQFTAAAILRLQEMGRLSIGDPLSRFFPSAPDDKRAVTLTQLMTHTSGFAQAYTADGIIDRAAAARAILAAPLANTPSAHFRYSNDNYSLLAIIVEEVSQRRFEAFVSEEIFARADLRAGGFWPDTHDDFVPQTLSPVDPPANVANWGFRGATGMRVSVADLHRWTRALDRGRVLSAESLALLFEPHARAGDGVDVAFGWFRSEIDGQNWLWTRGSESYGPNAILYRLVGTPLIVIAATNAGPAEEAGPGWSRVVRDALIAIYSRQACTPMT